MSRPLYARQSCGRCRPDFCFASCLTHPLIDARPRQGRSLDATAASEPSTLDLFFCDSTIPFLPITVHCDHVLFFWSNPFTRTVLTNHPSRDLSTPFQFRTQRPRKTTQTSLLQFGHAPTIDVADSRSPRLVGFFFFSAFVPNAGPLLLSFFLDPPPLCCLATYAAPEIIPLYQSCPFVRRSKPVDRLRFS